MADRSSTSVMGRPEARGIALLSWPLGIQHLLRNLPPCGRFVPLLLVAAPQYDAVAGLLDELQLPSEQHRINQSVAAGHVLVPDERSYTSPADPGSLCNRPDGINPPVRIVGVVRV